MALTIYSGGQTGVDRSALDIALDLGIPCGGWCPRGRLAEDGMIPEEYPLRETDSEEPEERTQLNIKESDATLIIHNGSVDRGTAYAIGQCIVLGKPMAEIDLSEPYNIESLREWVNKNKVGILNVAGPRESESEGIYREAGIFLHRLLSR